MHLKQRKSLMSKLIITIPGKPIPLNRPRFSKGHVYDSQAVIKEDLYWEIKQNVTMYNMARGVDFPASLYSTFKGPVQIHYTFFMPIAKSTSKKRSLVLIDTPHIKKPDTDNILKLYNDVCNGLLYYDDSQIYKLTATKLYSDNPRTEITLTYGESNDKEINSKTYHKT